jgi:4-amino-4-deoxy-L-arabinose transferase-like glycosyltransferase
VIHPTPALVTHRGARRLPRTALLLLCAAYVLPGSLNRDPWRSADLIAFAQMLSLAEGRSPWLAPALGGVPGDAALLPHWLGAGFILLLSPWVDSALAARVPFAILLALVLALVWYTTFHLARTDAAQPVPFAFGGEAEPVDYARAIADGALLALIATLGLLQLGHETTPELVQLFSVGLFLYALASAPFRAVQSRLAVLASLLLLSGSGAPSIAVAIGAGGMLVCSRSTYPQVRRFLWWLLAATVAAAAFATLLDAWRWRPQGAADWVGIARQWLWFLWPAWVLAAWTLWRWRHHLHHRHIAVPLVTAMVAMATNLVMGGSDRALMLALPGLAVLAAFALPTLTRSLSAAIDWFSMCFFTAAAIAVWVIYVAVQTGVPAKPAANVARLAPGFIARFSWLECALALLGTIGWLWLLRWRTGRHREAVWKSMVLPAAGVALCWLLAMTLWLPILDYARSSRACIAGPGLPLVTVAALEVFGGYQVDARQRAASSGRCTYLLRVTRGQPQADAPAGWEHVANVRRRIDRGEVTAIYRRTTP